MTDRIERAARVVHDLLLSGPDFRDFDRDFFWNERGMVRARAERIAAAVLALQDEEVARWRDIAERALESLVQGDASGNPECLVCKMHPDVSYGHAANCEVSELEDMRDAALAPRAEAAPD